MDPVSFRLDEIEKKRPRMAPFVLIATTLHIALPFCFFLLAHHKPQPRAAQLPTVSVRLIQQPQPRVRKPPTTNTRPVATPAPAPTAAPKPTSAPQPTAAPPREVPDKPRASADAMPDLNSRATPAPTPEPSDQSGIGRGGLSLGGSDAGPDSGIPSDFQFTYYLQRMLALIESRWYKPPVPPGTSARARFTILTGGQVQGIALELSSGNPSFDRAVLRALYAANPLPPLPPAYRKPSLTIHLTFTHNQ